MIRIPKGVIPKELESLSAILTIMQIQTRCATSLMDQKKAKFSWLPEIIAREDCADEILKSLTFVDPTLKNPQICYFRSDPTLPLARYDVPT